MNRIQEPLSTNITTNVFCISHIKHENAGASEDAGKISVKKIQTLIMNVIHYTHAESCTKFASFTASFNSK